jgi:ubiquitin-protein ligase E3 D
MPASQHIHIYAELLPHIRQVSVGCTLPSSVSATTEAIIAADGRVLTVIHDGSRQSLQLPGFVAPCSRLPVQRSGSVKLSWRLPLAAPPQNSGVNSASEESVPWSATDLKPGSAVVCRTCGSAVIGPGVLKVWKDLPSENWAEMMEFWHCHKPHDHKHSKEEQHLAQRGYGASSRVTAQPGVGFVDLTSFLLAESDVLESSVSLFLQIQR